MDTKGKHDQHGHDDRVNRVESVLVDRVKPWWRVRKRQKAATLHMLARFRMLFVRSEARVKTSAQFGVIRDLTNVTFRSRCPFRRKIEWGRSSDQASDITALMLDDPVIQY